MANKHVRNDILRSIFDALPSLLFVVDDDVRIHEYNAAAAGLLGAERETIIRQRTGEVLHCLHAIDVPDGCGRGPVCAQCVIRNAVNEGMQGHRVVRHRARLELQQHGKTAELYALITTAPFHFAGQTLVLLIVEDITEIIELQRLIPICSVCKKVRNDQESWMRIESYFKEHLDVNFTHGLCPECYQHEMTKLDQLFTEQPSAEKN